MNARFPRLLVSVLLGTALAAAAQVQPAPPVPGTAATPAPKAAAPTFVGPYRVITWDELVPAGWDPMKDFKDVNLASMTDGDPRAMQIMKRLREVWDNAPANAALDGKPVRIPGFVVPLEEGKDGMTEFLLVPYFGACIHSPPPPSNQIIHVKPKDAAKGVRSMDAVWISGTLQREKTDSYMGASSYRMVAQRVEPYTEPAATKK